MNNKKQDTQVYSQDLREVSQDIAVSLESISAIINATGTVEQKATVLELKESIPLLESLDGSDYAIAAVTIVSLLDKDSFNLDYVEEDIKMLKLYLSKLTMLKLTSVMDTTKKTLLDNNITIEDEVQQEADCEENLTGDEEVKIKTKTENKKDTKTEEMKTGAGANKETKTENKLDEDMIAGIKNKWGEEEIKSLREQLAEAKANANNCDVSTLAKIGKVSLGVAVVAGAAAGGYYYAKNYGGKHSTIILNSGDED